VASFFLSLFVVHHDLHAIVTNIQLHVEYIAIETVLLPPKQNRVRRRASSLHALLVVDARRRRSAVRGGTSVFCDDLALLCCLFPGAARTGEALPDLCVSGQATSLSIVRTRECVKC
jgi:hypothetical protein